MKTCSAVVHCLVMCTVLILLTGGCALVEKFFGVEEEKGAVELMAEGTESFERGNYGEAKEAFQKLKDRYPYSKYAVTAELKMADAAYEKEEFDEAYNAYEEFERLHPKNPEIPYAIYQKGMCQLRQVNTIDREQGHTLKAKEEFERLIGRFPRDEYAQRARKNVRKCLIFMADHELYIANFYYKMGKYRAALARYTYLIENYPDMGQYHQALELIARCKAKIANEEKQAQKEAEKKARKEAQKETAKGAEVKDEKK
jgi:outer membrane protein assembly factor BamD